VLLIINISHTTSDGNDGRNDVLAYGKNVPRSGQISVAKFPQAYLRFGEKMSENVSRRSRAIIVSFTAIQDRISTAVYGTGTTHTAGVSYRKTFFRLLDRSLVFRGRSRSSIRFQLRNTRPPNRDVIPRARKRRVPAEPETDIGPEIRFSRSAVRVTCRTTRVRRFAVRS